MLRQSRRDHIEDIVIKTTEEQDRKIEAFILERRRNPGIYNLAGRSCGSFVQDALRAGGIDPVGTVGGPGSFFELRKALNEAGTDFTKAGLTGQP